MFLNGKFISLDNPVQLEWCGQCIKQPVSISNQLCENHLGSSLHNLAVSGNKSEEMTPKLEYFTKYDVDPEVLHDENLGGQSSGETKSVSVEISDMMCTEDGHVFLCLSSTKVIQTKRCFENKRADGILKYTEKGKYMSMCKLQNTPRSICTLPTGTDSIISIRHGIQFVNLQEMTAGKTIKLVGSECGGVAVIKGMIYVGDHSAVHVLDQIGRLYKTIKVPCAPQIFTQNIDGRLYCACKSDLFCLSSDGSFVYSYNSSELGKVTSVKVDAQGRIFASGSELQVFYPYKPRIDRVLRKDDNHGEISAFCFSSDFSKVYVGHNDEKCVQLFTVMKTE